MSTPPPANPTPYVAAGPPAPTPILSILSLVAGGLSILCCCVPVVTYVAGLFGVTGIVLGVLARKREPNGKGLSLAGIITGSVGVFLGLLSIVYLVLTLFVPGFMGQLIPYGLPY